MLEVFVDQRDGLAIVPISDCGGHLVHSGVVQRIKLVVKDVIVILKVVILFGCCFHAEPNRLLTMRATEEEGPLVLVCVFWFHVSASY